MDPVPTDAAVLARRVRLALGEEPADLVLRGGRVLDVVSGTLVAGDVALAGDCVVGVGEGYRGVEELDCRGCVVVPGFVDAHVHLESSMVTPPEFQQLVLPRGTTTAICDPHEIANVLGREGIEYYLEAAGHLLLDLWVRLPSCVPATELETSGASLGSEDLLALRDHARVLGLAEVMNYPGVLARDPEVLRKLEAFQGRGVDGHCPLVTGRELAAYRAVGIQTDHESVSREEAEEKLRAGLHLLLREGSAARDVAALAPLVDPLRSPFLSFCTDDRSPLDVVEEGHLDHALRLAIAQGADPASAYRAVSWSAARRFGLGDRGLVAPGYRADLVVLEDYLECRVREVVAGGRRVASEEPGDFPVQPVGRDSIRLAPLSPEDFRVPGTGGVRSVIGVLPGQLLTEHLRLEVPVRDGEARPDPDRDILRVCVFERHGQGGGAGRGFARGFGLRRGALASSVGHDSHNLIVLGCEVSDMVVAANRLIELGGGIVLAVDGVVRGELPLPLAGLLSQGSAAEVIDALHHLRGAVRELGCTLPDPFLQLAFLPLPVIPHLKITDRGLVDVDRFELLPA